MSVISTLKRDLGSQFAHYRNLKEGWWMQIKRAFWATLYLCKGFKCAFNAMRREQLGSKVIYKGKKCFVNNWAGTDHPALGGADGFYEKNCPREEIKNIITLGELYHRFDFGLGFYMGSWHSIDVNKKLYGSGD